MKKVLLLLFLFQSLFSGLISAQGTSPDSTSLLKRQIAQAAQELIDSLPDVRMQAHEQLKNDLVKWLSQKESWRHPLEELPTLSVQYAADSSFRFITWQVETPDRHYRHGGIVQRRSSPQAPVLLHDRPPQARFSEYETTDATDWFGGLCYALYPFETQDGQTVWLCFFYDSYSPYIARKWVDVLHFDTNGKLRFGLPVFAKPDAFGGEDRLSRVLMEYFRQAATRFNYDIELGLIVKEHIIPYGMLPDRSGPAPVPDGSYEGFRYEKGLWKYEEKIFHQSLRDNEYPRPYPILDKRKDLFGKKQ